QRFAGTGGAPALTGVHQRHLHVVKGARAGDQVEALEDEPDLSVPDPRQLVVVEPGDVGAIEQVAAAGRHVQAADDVHQRRFARAACAHDGNEVATPDVEVDALQRRHLDPAHAVGLGDSFEGDHPPVPTRAPPKPPAPPRVLPVPVVTRTVGMTTCSPSFRPPVTSVNWSPATPVSIGVWTCCPPARTMTYAWPRTLPMTMKALVAVLVGSGAWLPGASAVVPPPGATVSPTTPLMLLTSPSIGDTSVVLLRFACAV